MIQQPFPSTIEPQTRTITFLTIRSVVKKIHEKRRSDGLMCLDKAWTRGGGGGCAPSSAFSL